MSHSEALTPTAYRLRGDDKIYSGDVLMNYGVKYVHNRDYDGTMFVAERV